MSPILSPRLGTILTGFLFLAALVQAAAGETEKRLYNIPASDGESALKSFSQQSGKGVIAATDLARGVKTNAINGEFTAAEAIGRMLDGTGLIAREDPKSGSFAVKRDSSPNAPRAVQADSDRPGNNAKAEESVVKMGQFEVFGSKLINADLPRTRDDVQPYVVFSRDQIESSNATNLPDFFRTRLPMNNATAGVAQGVNSPLGYLASVSLRGLSAQQTLILIDGRRAPTQFSSTSIVQSDFGGIPLSMIERIEILPSTASGIYGGGATGGVINIITRKDFAGVELTLSYGNTFQTDVARRRVDLNGSIALNRGRTHLTVASSYTDGNQLMARDRDFALRGHELQLANNPAAIYGATSPFPGYTTNIRSQNGSNLVLKPQYAVNGVTALNSPITFIPVGYAGVAVDGGAPLLANAGRYNLAAPDVSWGARSSIGSAPTFRSLALGARHQFTSWLEAYADFSVQNSHYQQLSGFTSSGSNVVTLSATVPNNPFTVPITVAYPPTDLFGVYSGQSKNEQGLLGVALKLPHDWTISLEYARAKNTTRSSQPATLVGDPDGAGPLPSFATAVANSTLDVMRDLNRYPLDYTAYRMPKTHSVAPQQAKNQEWTARGSGGVWTLPGGPLTLAGSVTWHEDQRPSSVLENQTVVPSTFVLFPELWLRSTSGYLEARAPIFQENAAGWRRALELQASVRYDNYEMHTLARNGLLGAASPDGPFPPFTYVNPRFEATSRTFGFKYAPVPDVALRASGGTGFLIPSLSQLGVGSPNVSSFPALVDPKRGNTAAPTGPVATLVGPIGDLGPEYSESVSAGLVFTPRILPGFRLSIDYTRIKKREEIASLNSVNQLLDVEDYIPGLVIRAPLTTQDQALGYTGGAITGLRFATVNVARKDVVAYDFQADYEKRSASWGTFRFYAVATYQPRLASQVTLNAAFVNTVGFTSGLKWRGNAGLDWNRGPWAFAWNVQYYDSYLGYSATAAAPVIAAFVLNQGSARISSQHYHDITVGYSFRAKRDDWCRWLANTRLSVGVQNLLNTRPPVLATTTIFNSGFSGYGDPRLSRYTVTVRKQF